ncbi:MAG: cysteine desulfurase-like protein, partial [Candidatus Eremiobacteraeota bacterium]|nr:cysteine desulfurase-like protein [Candidatus Eremiobacteraeota bacterium]
MNSFAIDAVRAAFPSLALTDDGKPRIYLDNPAGTQVPRTVAEAVARAMIESNANLGGYFVTSRASERIVETAHRAMATFLNARSYREIVIAQSMTNLTFHLSRCIGRTLQRGDEIVVTRMDHDGNIAPWLALAEDLGLTVRWVPFDFESWVIEPDAFSAALSERTRLVALNYASNLTGSVNDVKTLTQLAKQAGALVYVDAVQYAPHNCIDVQDLGCDFLTCSSYKFYGPHLGILWGREELLAELYPYKARPQTDEMPWRFETGTPQIELQAALTATIAYFASLGGAQNKITRDAIVDAFDATAEWERTLAVQLVRGLQSLPDVTIYGITDESVFDRRVPTVSFRHATRTPPDIAAALAEENIFVWSGNNFALEVVRAIGADETEGVVRIGMAHYNTPAEIDMAL